jgi:hypothetical protein
MLTVPVEADTSQHHQAIIMHGIHCEKEEEEDLTGCVLSIKSACTRTVTPEPVPLLDEGGNRKEGPTETRYKKVRFRDEVEVFPHKRVLSGERGDYWWTVPELQQSTIATVKQYREGSLDLKNESARGLESFCSRGPDAVHRVHVQTVMDDIKRQKLMKGTVDSEKLRKASQVWSKPCSEKAVAVALADRADVEQMWPVDSSN